MLLYGAELSGAAVVLGAYQHAPHALRRRRSSRWRCRCCAGAAAAPRSGRARAALLRARPARRVGADAVPAQGKHAEPQRARAAGGRARAGRAGALFRPRLRQLRPPIPARTSAGTRRPTGACCSSSSSALETPFALPAGLSGYPERARTRAARQDARHAARGRRAARRPRARCCERSRTATRAASGSSCAAVARRARPSSRAPRQLRRTLAVDLATRRTACAGPRPHEDAIGFVSAGVRLDACGRDRRGARRRRLLSAPRAAGPELAGACVGERADSPKAWAQRSTRCTRHEPGMIEGVRSLNTLRNALLDAAARAAQHA